MRFQLIVLTIIYSLMSFCLASANATIIPVVSVEENDRLEELAEETGANEWRFMTKAGVAVGIETKKILERDQSNKVIVLVGKGYNGGNALWAGLFLKQKGYDVIAYLLFPSTDSPIISQEVMKLFKEAGGVLLSFKPERAPNADVIIDGILGTSFQGGASGVLADAIVWANQSEIPIVSVDIPSGLNGTTGYVGTVGIHATHTVTFFFPRIGFFVGDGLNHVGTLSIVNLGIRAEILSQLNPEAFLITENEERNLPLHKPTIFFGKVPLYYISDNYQIHEYFNFLDDHRDYE